MRIYIKHIVLVLVLVILPRLCFGQEGGTGLNVRDAEIRRSDDTVEVGFTVDAGRFPRDGKVTLVPVVYDRDGNTYAMEVFTLAGRRKSISDRRSGELRGVVVKGKKTQALVYSASAQWQHWMNEVSLAVYRFDAGCADRYEERPAVIAATDRLIHYDIAPSFSTAKIEIPAAGQTGDQDMGNPFLRPVAGYLNRFEIFRSEKGQRVASVYFRTGKYDIDPLYRDNASSLDALREAYTMIREKGSAEVRRIFIAGFASPEGSYRFNTALSGKRAAAVREYLGSNLGLGGEMFEVYNGGENWNGLRRMVEESDMPEREKVLYIIDGHRPGQEISKQKLKYFADGVPYGYIRQHFFPELRSAGYVNIYYEVDPVETEAITLEREKAGSINASQELMEKGRWQQALEELEKAGDDPRTYNPRGVCLMMLGEYEGAEKLFLKALDSDDGHAAANLGQLETARKVIK